MPALSERVRGETTSDGRGDDVKEPLLQTLYRLSHAQAEFEIMDRRNFGRFFGLEDGGRVSDETTIWRFREARAFDAGLGWDARSRANQPGL